MSAILFDLDGTIADSVPVIIETAIQTCRELGVSINAQQISELIGVPLIVQGEKLLGPGRGEEYYHAYHRKYMSLQEDCIQAFDGMREVLETCRRLDAKTGVVTSKGKDGTDFSLKCLKLPPLLDVVVHAHSQCGFKPEAGPALCALEQVGETPQNGLFVGDSIFDIRCGKNAGMLTCAVLWGAGTQEELEAEHPDYIAASPAELKEIICKFIYAGNTRR